MVAAGSPCPAVVPSRKRRWLFRLLAVSLAGVPFVLFEAVCWCCGWGAESDAADPFVALSTQRPLFDRSPDGERWQITPCRQRFFSDESFAAVKPPGTKRAFVVGESTVAGEPFGKPTSFSTFLELALNAAGSDASWDVVNCGGVSYASYRLAPIVEECLTHQSDLIILAVGHNEFLEDRTYAPIRSLPVAVRSLYNLADHSRSFHVARSWVQPSAAVSALPETVKTRLDYEQGLAGYRRNEAQRRAVIAHYEFNLRRMVRATRAAGVPLILIRQPSNLADCPPFKSEYAPELSAADRTRCENVVDQARQRLASNLPQATALLEKAVRIDPTHARTQFELAKCYEARGQIAEARTAYLAARDHDVCPLRMLSEMERILFDVAQETSTPLVDVHALLEEQSPSGILGGYLLVDHVHPSITGHQLIARRLVQELEALGLSAASPDRAAACDAALAAHLATLDSHYYLRGQRTLRSLQAWAAGRAALTPTVPDAP